MNPNLDQNQGLNQNGNSAVPGNAVIGNVGSNSSSTSNTSNVGSTVNSENLNSRSINSTQSNIQNQNLPSDSVLESQSKIASVGMPETLNNAAPSNEASDNTQDSINKEISQTQVQSSADQKEEKSSGNSKNTKGGSRSKSRDIIKGEKPKESFLQKLNMYAIPIIAVIALIILTILLYIPTINQILDTRTDIENLQAEVDFSKDKLESLQSINLQELDSLLGTVSKVVRDNMDVATLASEVESTAQENDLKPSKISFQGSEGSSSLSSEDEMDSVSEYARSISGPFSFYGTKVDVVNFLRDLRLESSTVLALSSVDIGKYGAKEESEDSEQLWNVDIEIRGYLVAPVTSTEVLAPISVDTDEDILEEIQSIVDEDYSEESDDSEGTNETDDDNSDNTDSSEG